MKMTELNNEELNAVAGGILTTKLTKTSEAYEDAGIDAYVLFEGNKYEVEKFRFVKGHEAVFQMKDRNGDVHLISDEMAQYAVDYHAKNGAQISYEKLVGMNF